MATTTDMKRAALANWRETAGETGRTETYAPDDDYRLSCTFRADNCTFTFRYERFGSASGWGSDGRGAPTSHDVNEDTAAGFLLALGEK